MGSSRPRQILYSLCKSALFAEPLGVRPSGCICLVDGVHQYSLRLDNLCDCFGCCCLKKGIFPSLIIKFSRHNQNTDVRLQLSKWEQISPSSDTGFCLTSFTCAKICIRILDSQNVFVFCEIYFWIAHFRLSCRSLTWWIIVTEMIKEVEPAVSLKNARFLDRRALYSLLFFSFVGRNNRIFSGGKMTRALIL